MEFFLQEIENALNARLYYLAIVATVTIPDVCAALASPTGESNGAAYKDLYNSNVGQTLTWFTDADCWKLRCGGVHQGRFGHKDMQYDRAVFLLPGPVVMQNCRLNNPGQSAYLYSVVDFCNVFIGAARKWFKAMEHDPIVKANLPHLVQLYPNGLRPYGNIPLIT